MKENAVLAEIENACMTYKICVLPRNPKRLPCSVWDMPDTAFHVGVIWRSNTGGMRSGARFIRFGMAGLADFSGFLFASGQRVEIEAKSDKGELTPDQEKYRELCLAANVKWGLARSYDGCCRLLEGWGLVSRQKSNAPGGLLK